MSDYYPTRCSHKVSTPYSAVVFMTMLLPAAGRLPSNFAFLRSGNPTDAPATRILFVSWCAIRPNNLAQRLLSERAAAACTTAISAVRFCPPATLYSTRSQHSQ